MMRKTKEGFKAALILSAVSAGVVASAVGLEQVAQKIDDETKKAPTFSAVEMVSRVQPEGNAVIRKPMKTKLKALSEKLEKEAKEPETQVEPVVYAQEHQEPQAESEMVYAGTYKVCGYDICQQCCGKTDGITASGAAATVGRTCASNDFPFGTVLYIDGIGYRTVEDRGGMANGVIDVLCADHPGCYAITGNYSVYVVG